MIKVVLGAESLTSKRECGRAAELFSRENNVPAPRPGACSSKNSGDPKRDRRLELHQARNSGGGDQRFLENLAEHLGVPGPGDLVEVWRIAAETGQRSGRALKHVHVHFVQEMQRSHRAYDVLPRLALLGSEMLRYNPRPGVAAKGNHAITAHGA